MTQLAAIIACLTLLVFSPISGSAQKKAKADSHDHDHGKKETKKTEAKEEHDHAHAHTAPHDGTLILIGDEFAHLELVLDTKAGKLTAYALDSEPDQPVRIGQKSLEAQIRSLGDGKTSLSLTLKPVENPLTGEKVGDTSEFSGQADALKKLKEFNIEFKSIKIKGTEFKNVKSEFPKGNH